MKKQQYERPEAVALYIRLEAAVLSVATTPFDEDDDDIFGDN